MDELRESQNEYKSKASRLEVGDTFYVLLDKKDHSGRLSSSGKLIIYRDFEDAVNQVIEYLGDGLSAAEVELMKIQAGKDGSLSSSPIDWKKIVERLVKERNYRRNK